MLIDHLICEFDRGLRTLFATPHAMRTSPAAAVDEGELSVDARKFSAALMRVNHSGEVCAQALYQGQAITTRNVELREALSRAAQEEIDHLAWSHERIVELGGNTSMLNPLWYAGSLATGMLAGSFGDGWNLGFLAETETQVEQHLQGHMQRLDSHDHKTQAVIDAMQRDEAGHAQHARELGAKELPPPIKAAMRCAARLMTGTSFRI
ncbi:MAG: 2-polyprenyl-3-methyl-6-methoxy-1,4-benzoquinone monooxygenase [Burkholderiales bacterium]